jgi:hypothetical protein
MAGCIEGEGLPKRLAVMANHIPCLDMWRDLGINRYNYKNFSLDGAHPNAVAAKKRGETIASFIDRKF